MLRILCLFLFPLHSLASQHTGIPPLFAALKSGNPYAVKEMLARGEDPDIPNAFGLTPLFIVMREQRLEIRLRYHLDTIQDLLLAYGAHAYAHSVPASINAVRFRDPSLIAEHSGATLGEKNHYGMSALDIIKYKEQKTPSLASIYAPVKASLQQQAESVHRDSTNQWVIEFIPKEGEKNA